MKFYVVSWHCSSTFVSLKQILLLHFFILEIFSIDLFNKEVQDDMLFCMLLQFLDASVVAFQM